MKNKTVPVIDIRELRSQQTLAALDEACRQWGFFQVTHHDIADALIEDVQTVTRRFFHQPAAVKREVARTRENPWGFYDRELTKNTRDQKEVFDFGPADGPAIVPQWPAADPEFRQVMSRYFRACEALAYQLLSAISLNLGMSAGFLSRGFGPRHSSFLRLNYYPDMKFRRRGDSPFGVNQHTDAGAMTLLLQDEQPGLEVFHDGRWSAVEPRLDALVINIGDIVQVWSNDHYRAALHRVPASRGYERFSVPFFFNPAYRANYAPVPALIANGEPPRYKTINWGQFRTLRADGDYADYGEEVQIDRFKIVA
jgi:isopenicillin N synthase-like dioxygenase